MRKNSKTIKDKGRENKTRKGGRRSGIEWWHV